MSFWDKIREWARPNLPTRTCPHRYCRQAHHMWTTLGLAVLVLACVRSPEYLLWFILFGAIAMIITSRIWKKPKQHVFEDDLLQEELNRNDIAQKHLVTGETQPRWNPKRTVFPGGLQVRKGWALAAVLMDVLWIVLMATLLVTSVQSPDDANPVPSMDVSGFVSTAVGFGMVGFYEFCHYMGTKPRKPRKQRFWGLAPQGSKA